MVLSLHQQVFAVIGTTQNHIVHFADIHQLGATRVRNRALQVFLHFAHGVLESTFDGLQNALAFHMLVFTLVEVRR